VHGEEGEGVTLLSTALRALPEGALRCDVVLGLNPDGLARGTRGNARGVDLNRNLPASNWRGEPVPYRRTLEDPRDVVLSPGAHAGSEPETCAFLTLVEQCTPRLIVTVHAPLACIDDPAETGIGRWLAERTGLAHVSDVGYPTPGSLGSWGAEQGIPIVTWELEREASEVLIRRHLDTVVALLAGEVAP
jgi:protein MpaA